MTTNFSRLAEISGRPLSDATPRLTAELASLAGGLSDELLRLLWARNGFFAFESALHVFSIGDGANCCGLERWNDPQGWRSEFNGMADRMLFFAEDIFGGQFCIADGAVHHFEPETGRTERKASGIDEWAGLVLRKSEEHTGWPLGHEWQTRFGALLPGKRLVPKKPFVLGGGFTVENLFALDAVRAMKTYANLATQIRDLPDGTQVRFQVVE